MGENGNKSRLLPYLKVRPLAPKLKFVVDFRYNLHRAILPSRLLLPEIGTSRGELSDMDKLESPLTRSKNCYGEIRYCDIETMCWDLRFAPKSYRLIYLRQFNISSQGFKPCIYSTNSDPLFYCLQSASENWHLEKVVVQIELWDIKCPGNIELMIDHAETELKHWFKDYWVFPKCFHWIRWQIHYILKKIIQTCHLLYKRPRCYRSTSKIQVERGSLNWAQFMLQWFIRFPEFSEFTGFLIPFKENSDMNSIFRCL